MNSRDLARYCRDAADDKKAEDIVVMDMHKLSDIADYLVICSGGSDRHVKAICEEIHHVLRKKNCWPFRSDGVHEGQWAVIDYIDVIVHVFQKDLREYYQLERLWGDARIVRFRKKLGTSVKGDVH
ncbi:MAG: ribosome silencing factor [Candidatus Theseobacter exili]|nr:ribosome silencing factor [Candidatus Theseobacter exili]